MSLLNGEDLFGSGAHTFEVGGKALRAQVTAPPGIDGVRVTASGRTGREITQRGVLVADDAADLQLQLDRIEEALDARAGTLVDQEGGVHEGVVMMKFSPGPARRNGLRLVVPYVVLYVQTV